MNDEQKQQQQPRPMATDWDSAVQEMTDAQKEIEDALRRPWIYITNPTLPALRPVIKRPNTGQSERDDPAKRARRREQEEDKVALDRLGANLAERVQQLDRRSFENAFVWQTTGNWALFVNEGPTQPMVFMTFPEARDPNKDPGQLLRESRPEIPPPTSQGQFNWSTLFMRLHQMKDEETSRERVLQGDREEARSAVIMEEEEDEEEEDEEDKEEEEEEEDEEEEDPYSLSYEDYSQLTVPRPYEIPSYLQGEYSDLLKYALGTVKSEPATVAPREWKFDFTTFKGQYGQLPLPITIKWINKSNALTFEEFAKERLRQLSEKNKDVDLRGQSASRALLTRGLMFFQILNYLNKSPVQDILQKISSMIVYDNTNQEIRWQGHGMGHFKKLFNWPNGDPHRFIRCFLQEVDQPRRQYLPKPTVIQGVVFWLMCQQSTYTATPFAHKNTDILLDNMKKLVEVVPYDELRDARAEEQSATVSRQMRRR